MVKNPKLIKGVSDHNSRPDQPSSSSSGLHLTFHCFFFFIHALILLHGYHHHLNLVKSNQKVSPFLSLEWIIELIVLLLVCVSHVKVYAL